jgi:hypothetical protein
MTRDPAFAAGITRFFAGPLVGCPFLMGGFPALAGYLALLGRIHRRESTIFFGHLVPPHPFVPSTRENALFSKSSRWRLQPKCHETAGVRREIASFQGDIAT